MKEILEGQASHGSQNLQAVPWKAVAWKVTGEAWRTKPHRQWRSQASRGGIGYVLQGTCEERGHEEWSESLVAPVIAMTSRP